MQGLLPYFSVACLILGAAGADAIESGTQESPQTAHLNPGDFVWHPESAPDGPVVIVVDLAQQRLQVFRNGVQIGRSTVSSGEGKYATPAGIFTIVQKQVTHHSNLYHEARMPYMERLTWSGLAIHAGNVPDHPESHGCVHVPMDFAKKLYDITSQGCTVLITNGQNSSGPTDKPDLAFSTGTTSAPKTSPATPFVWRPDAAPTGSLSVVYSSADRQVHVYRAGVEIGRADTGNAAPPDVGNRVYAAHAQTAPDGSHQWNLLGSLESSPAPNAADVLHQLNIPPPFRDDMRKTITPGTTLVLTDEPVDRTKPGDPGSDIMDTADQANPPAATPQ